MATWKAARTQLHLINLHTCPAHLKCDFDFSSDDR